MNWWFVTLVILGFLNLGINLGKHGKSRSDEEYNFWAALIGVGLQIGISYMAIKVGF